MERDASFQEVFGSPYFVHLRELSENNQRVLPDLSPRKRSDFNPRASCLLRPMATVQQEVEVSAIGKELRPSQTERSQDNLSFPTFDRDKAEADQLGRAPSLKHDSNPRRSSTWTFPSEQSVLQPSLPEVKLQTAGNLLRERTDHYVPNGETATLKHGSLEASMKTDDCKPGVIRDSTSFSSFPPYNAYKTELNVLQRALLTSQARESQESILALLTEAAANLQSLQNSVSFRQDNRTDNTTLRDGKTHPMFYTDDWEERLVGKSKSMRALSNAKEENKVLRQALYSMRPATIDQYSEKVFSQRFSEAAPLFEDPVQDAYSSSCRHLIGEEVQPRTMSMREPLRWGGSNIDVSSPMWMGGGHRSPSHAYCYNSVYGRSTPVFSGGACSPNAMYGIYDPVWQQDMEDQFFHKPQDEAMKRDRTARTAQQFSSGDGQFPFCSCGVRSYLDSNNTNYYFQDSALPLPQQFPVSRATHPVTNPVFDQNNVANNYPKRSSADSSTFPRHCDIQAQHKQPGHSQHRGGLDQHSHSQHKNRAHHQEGQNGRILASALDPGKCHSMRYDRVSWADEQAMQAQGQNTSAKIDRSRTHSSREALPTAAQCAMCGQRLRGEVAMKDDAYPRGLPLRLCPSCHPGAPSSCSPPTLSGPLHRYLQRRAGGGKASAQQAFGAPPPSPAVAKSRACRPSASRKKASGFIELCRQWMRFAAMKT